MIPTGSDLGSINFTEVGISWFGNFLWKLSCVIGHHNFHTQNLISPYTSNRSFLSLLKPTFFFFFHGLMSPPCCSFSQEWNSQLYLLQLMQLQLEFQFPNQMTHLQRAVCKFQRKHLWFHRLVYQRTWFILRVWVSDSIFPNYSIVWPWTSH